MIGGVVSGVIRPPTRGLTRNTGGGGPRGYAVIRIGSPFSYQTLVIGSAGSTPRVLIPVGA